jgi:hypothetical protein
MLGKPNSEELEIHVFGPGYGESVLVHLGSGDWLVIMPAHTHPVPDPPRWIVGPSPRGPSRQRVVRAPNARSLKPRALLRELPIPARPAGPRCALSAP